MRLDDKNITQESLKYFFTNHSSIGSHETIKTVRFIQVHKPLTEFQNVLNEIYVGKFN